MKIVKKVGNINRGGFGIIDEGNPSNIFFGVIGVPIYVLLSVSWFSVNSCNQLPVQFGDPHIQKW